MRNPPILVAVIGFFAALAGFSFLFFGLRAIGFDWFGAFGDLPAFNNVGLWGWLAVVTGIIWLLAALGLWALQPWARLFAMFMCGLALLEAAIAFFQFPGAGIALGMALMPAVILWYLSTSEVKIAFGLEDLRSANQAAEAPQTFAASAQASPGPGLALRRAHPRPRRRLLPSRPLRRSRLRRPLRELHPRARLPRPAARTT